MDMPENKHTEKTYDLGRKVRGAQEKDEFVPFLDPVFGSKHNNHFFKRCKERRNQADFDRILL